MRVWEEKFLRGWYDTRSLVNGEWVPAVLVALADGPKHYTDLLSIIRSYDVSEGWSSKRRILHDSILTRTLKKMTADGLILREQEAGSFPPSVIYTLNRATMELLDAVEPMAEWAETHGDLIKCAQWRRSGGTQDLDPSPDHLDDAGGSPRGVSEV